MDTIYLVEIRLGRTKWKAKQTVLSIASRYCIGAFMERHPHVTLYGPMELLEGVSQQQVLDAIATIATGYNPVPFTLDRFEKREGMHGSVIAFSVRPSEDLKQMTAEISRSLSPITRTHNAWDDRPEEKWYHVTVANRLDRKKASSVFQALPQPGLPDTEPSPQPEFFSRIHNYLRSLMGRNSGHPIRPLLLDEAGLRITVMHGENILAEYDLMEKRWIHDNHRHDSQNWRETLADFRKYAGFERAGPVSANPGDILLIGDLHLGHANIIRYCARPFLVSDPAEMDRVLIANWNAAATPGTRIFHLGDLHYGSTTRPAREYREQLNGDVTFISGNHDEPGTGSRSSALIDHDGMKFFLVHDPEDAPADFDGWVVHGHHHNNDLRNFPFIDFEHRRINVSAEVVGYVPASLSDICRLIRYHEETGNRSPVLLNYPYVE